MSKTTAVWAFFAGFCCALLSNNSMPVVSASAPTAQVSDANRPRMSRITVSNFGGIAVGIAGAIPQFISLEKTPIVEELTVSSGTQPLDGLDCRNCTFDNATLTYGGGPFNFVNARFSGATTLQFVGAAANTLSFLDLLKSVSTGTSAKSPKADEPVRRKAVARTAPATKTRPKIDFTAPFIGQK